MYVYCSNQDRTKSRAGAGLPIPKRDDGREAASMQTIVSMCFLQSIKIRGRVRRTRCLPHPLRLQQQSRLLACLISYLLQLRIWSQSHQIFAHVAHRTLLLLPFRRPCIIRLSSVENGYRTLLRVEAIGEELCGCGMRRAKGG